MYSRINFSGKTGELIRCYKQTNKNTMANPIKETPVLYGEDARRFAERIANPVMETPEKAARLEQVYQWYLQALERGKIQEIEERSNKTRYD